MMYRDMIVNDAKETKRNCQLYPCVLIITSLHMNFILSSTNINVYFYWLLKSTIAIRLRVYQHNFRILLLRVFFFSPMNFLFRSIPNILM